MKTMVLRAMLLLMVVILFSVEAFASGNISSTDKYAWSDTSGWVNFSPTNAGVMLYSDHLEGYAWAENIGWVKLGSYSGGGAHTYNNSSNSDWGVNLDGSGHLLGFGWSETSGWIRFDPAHSQVVLDTATGSLDGYAWGENTGWIHFRNSGQTNGYGVASVRFTITLDPGAGGGITCSTAIQGWDVTCTITPLDGYYVSGITDGTPVPNPGNSHTITAISGDHTIAVSFSEYLVKRLIAAGGHAYYMDPQSAYGAPAADSDVIQCKDGLFTGPLTFDQSVTVWLEGGYDSEFGDNTVGVTTITGALDIQTGTVIIENIEIQ